MGIHEAKRFLNSNVRLTWTNRKGDEISDSVFVYEVGFVPLYGPCLVTSKGEIRLDRIHGCELIEASAA